MPSIAYRRLRDLDIPGDPPRDAGGLERHRFEKRRELLEFLVGELESILPGSTWTAAGIGRHQLTVNHWALELGGHARTGVEDNVRFDDKRLAASNAELVGRVAELTAQYGRRPATASEARAMLALTPTAA